MDDVKLAMLGNKEAAKRLTEAGVLVPCPWCRETPKVHSFQRQKELFAPTYIECGCGTRTRIFGNVKRAVGYWNTRAPILSEREIEMLEGME